jgi:hypothetical protein
MVRNFNIPYHEKILVKALSSTSKTMEEEEK